MLKTSYYESIQDTLTKNIVTTNGYTNYPSHFHKKIEITYVENGSCSSVIAQNNFDAQTDEILYVPEYYPHSYKTSEDVIRQIFLPTDVLLLDVKHIIEQKTFPLLLKNKQFNRDYLLPILKNILIVQNDKKINETARFILIKGYTNEFFGHLYQMYGRELSFKEKKFENFAEILIYIDENFDKNITLESISKHFGYNKHYFSKMFNRNTNTSLQNYINTLRIKYFIKRYNEKNHNNITTIAFEVGFDSMPSFYRAFKRIHGISPKEYFSK